MPPDERMTSLLSESLLKRFFLLSACLVIMTALSSQMFFARQERTNLETRLREKASFINRYSADRIASALIQKDDVTLLQVINQLEEDQEIFSIYVIDQRGDFRYHRDSERVGTPASDAAILNTLKTGEASIAVYENSGGKALALLTPLVVRSLPGPLGAIRIDLTYRSIEQQVTSSRKRFWFIIIGSLMTCFAFVSLFVHRWVLQPLQNFRTTLSSLNPASPDPSLPEYPDEFGKVAAAFNQLVRQIKNELQRQTTALSARAEQEKAWIEQLATTLLPGARIIVADKDNRVVSDTGEPSPKSDRKRPHLLDLITETNFANLLTGAFQKEGEAVRGDVTFQENKYNAMILSVPAQQSVAVKTLIALIPN